MGSGVPWSFVLQDNTEYLFRLVTGKIMNILWDGEIAVFISMGNSIHEKKKRNCKTSVWEGMWHSGNRTLSLKELGGKLPIEVFYLQLIQSDTFIWFACCFDFFILKPFVAYCEFIRKIPPISPYSSTPSSLCNSLEEQ